MICYKKFSISKGIYRLMIISLFIFIDTKGLIGNRKSDLQTIPEKGIEYRLFNLSVSIPLDFKVEQAHPFKVKFLNLGISGKAEPAAVMEIYYFPKILANSGPKSLPEFLKDVWPEAIPLLKNAPLENNNSGSMLSKIEMPVASLFFNTGTIGIRSKEGQGNFEIMLFHWLDKKRRYFIHIMYKESEKKHIEPRIKSILESLEIIFLTSDRKIISKRIGNILDQRGAGNESAKKTQEMNNELKKFFFDPLYFQGHLSPLRESWPSFKRAKLILGQAILLEQDDLSDSHVKKISQEEFLVLQENIKVFSSFFTSGDIVIYLPADTRVSESKDKSIREKKSWVYFIMRKVVGQWQVYALGYELGAQDARGIDSKKNIFW